MISQKEIIEIAEQKRLKIKTIDKDWVLGHFLNAMYSFPDIKAHFVFKGGTALKKCYFQEYRFSEDLDFTLLDKGFKIDDAFIRKIAKTASNNSGIKFHLFKQKFQKSDDMEQGYEITIKYWGADHKPNQMPPSPLRWQSKIKLDISFSEKLLTTPEPREIFHEYSDKKQITNVVPVYSLHEIISEKLRALLQRNRPRDIYDIYYISQLIPENNYPEIKNLLFQKADAKVIKINSIQNFANEDKHRKNKKAWHSSLEDHLPIGDLPEFDVVYQHMIYFIEKILKS